MWNFFFHQAIYRWKVLTSYECKIKQKKIFRFIHEILKGGKFKERIRDTEIRCNPQVTEVEDRADRPNGWALIKMLEKQPSIYMRNPRSPMRIIKEYNTKTHPHKITTRRELQTRGREKTLLWKNQDFYFWLLNGKSEVKYTKYLQNIQILKSRKQHVSKSRDEGVFCTRQKKLTPVGLY